MFKEIEDAQEKFRKIAEMIDVAGKAIVEPYKNIGSDPPPFDWGEFFGKEDSYVVDYQADREDFLEYLKMRHYNERYAADILRYLDRFLKKPIGSPKDVIKLFAPLTPGQSHHLNRGFRVFLNYLEIIQQASGEFLSGLRKAIPKDELRHAVDLKIPSESTIKGDLRKIENANPKYHVLYDLLLDSGLRLVEACMLINDFSEGKAQKFDGFYCYETGMFRRTKTSYYAFITQHTFEELLQSKEKVMSSMTTTYFTKNALTRPKYIRKFVNDVATSEELNIPESVVDFIQGRSPKTVGATRYMKLRRKAIQFYPRWAKYATQLRNLRRTR